MEYIRDFTSASAAGDRDCHSAMRSVLRKCASGLVWMTGAMIEAFISFAKFPRIAEKCARADDETYAE